MRISDISSLVNFTDKTSTKSNISDVLKSFTGRVTDMAKAAASSSTSSSTAAESPVPVRFGQTVQQIKKLSDTEAMENEAATALTRMKEIAASDLSKMSDEGRITASVEYKSLQRTVSRLASKSGLSAASTSEADAKTGKADVMAEAMKVSPGSTDAVAKLDAALGFVSKKKTELGDKIDALYVEGKQLGTSMRAIYDSLKSGGNGSN